jgi:hypothetical protein
MNMKKLLITCLALMAFVIPSIAQVDHDYNPNDLIPASGTVLKKNNIPTTVVKAAQRDFNIDDTLTWTKFPYAIHEYGWVYDKGASDIKPDRYEVNMKSQEGNDLFAVYSADGNLIASRELLRNVPVPPSVRESLSKSKYNDWKIVGDEELIRYYHDKNSVEQHFRLTVEKGNAKRSISFNYQATANNYQVTAK